MLAWLIGLVGGRSVGLVNGKKVLVFCTASASAALVGVSLNAGFVSPELLCIYQMRT